MRTVIAVIAGYVIFAASAVLLFNLTGHDPHAVASGQFMMVSIVYGMAFDFFNISAWRELGETIANYKKKGDPILVEGRLQYRTWEAQDGSKRSAVDVVADNVQFLGRPGDSDDGTSSGGGAQARSGGGGRGGRREEVDIDETDFEDIPFRYVGTRPLIVRSIL